MPTLTRPAYHLPDTLTAGYYALLAAIYRQAVDDAQRGKDDAVYWLDYSFPEWRRYTTDKQRSTAGEILAELPREQGARTDLTSVQDGPKLESYQAAIREADIAPTTAKRWQDIAKIPEEVFEAHLAETKAEKEELTSYGVHKLSNNIRRAEKVEKILEKNQPLEDSLGPFSVHMPERRFTQAQDDLRL